MAHHKSRWPFQNISECGIGQTSYTRNRNPQSRHVEARYISLDVIASVEASQAKKVK
jgi:hypothetical protein